MSDESTIAAAALIPQLSAAPIDQNKNSSEATNAGDSSPDERIAGSFSELLSTNLDAEIDSATQADIRDSLRLTASQSGLTNSATDHQASTAAGTIAYVDIPPQGAQLGSGNELPTLGQNLPASEAGALDLLSSEESQALARLTQLSNQDAVDTNQESQQGLDTALGRGDLLARQQAGDSVQDLTVRGEITNEDGSQRAIALTPASIGAEQTGLKAINTYTSTQAQLETNQLDNFSTDSGGLQNSNDQELEKLLLQGENRNQRSTRAEFSLNNSSSTELLDSVALSSTRGNDSITSAASLLNAPITLQQGGLPVSSAQVALGTDRAAAANQIAQHVANFVRQGDDYAEINLSPPHLGKISVRIALQNDQASIVLNSSTPEVREAMETSLDRLNSLLSEAGLTLADASVADQSQHQESSESSKPSNTSEFPASEEIEKSHEPGSERIINRGLLDAYA